MNEVRQLVRVIASQPSADGDGVKIHRIGGRQYHAVLDPFLMLDEIRSDDSADYIGGFPPHPHRGFETITYMLEGRLRHSDHLGNNGVLEPGGLQWMVAGRGVIHSEMPEQEQGLLHGFQLWLNLPAAAKMQSASYRDFSAADFPVVQAADGVQVRVLAGAPMLDGVTVTAPVTRPSTEPVILDVALDRGAEWSWRCGDEANLLVYVVTGAVEGLVAGQMGVFQGGDRLQLRAPESAVRLLVLSGRPLREPVWQYGPFVMNSMAEIEQTLAEYNSGRFPDPSSQSDDKE